jgi:hypothetical protein
MANQTQRTTRSSTARQSRGRSIGSVSTTQRGASHSPTRTVQRPTTIVVDRTYDHVLKILGFDRLTHPDHPVIQDLLDPNYVPTTSDNIGVFKAKQEYLYSVFVNILLTDEGKKALV